MTWAHKILDEIQYEFTRASGPGGQHVNKTETAVVLRWSLTKTKVFSDQQKSLLFEKLQNKLNQEGEVVLKSLEFRDRLMNKQNANEKLISLLRMALHVPKKRLKTKPTKSSKRKRLESKSKHSAKKELRRKGFD
ncbi:MAG: aminoacyl-tRNA hydrolase [Oligoflexia bacterium]|nr:MAG: aminoacyl-tRNA hydrolase [Oligoflexia bacterium]